jgi:UDP-N-acetylmuramyl tripeptide synthase
MRILDSRRLTGPNLLLDGPGAILDVELAGLDSERAIAAWRSEARLLLEALGWRDATLAARAHPGGASLAFSAPLDALYAATEVNEAAWHRAARALGGAETPRAHGGDPRDSEFEDASEDGDTIEDFDESVARLGQTIARERRPALLRLAGEAARRGVTLLSDDRRISVGLGAGSLVWPVEETETLVDRIPWDELYDVPVALVTGTNGKTTTVRLLAAIARAAGRVAGVTSTDRVTVGEEVVAVGDYSGPNGARTVLRDRRAQVALLEVARGGILRRGLAVPRATAALVTNVANDHLGEYGIFDLDSLADAKMVVTRALVAGGRAVLNADDPRLWSRALRLGTKVIAFTLDPGHPGVAQHLTLGGDACRLLDGALVLSRGGTNHEVAALDAVPMSLGGAARHNVANALGAIGVAVALGFSLDAVRTALRSFENSPSLNPGRGNVWTLGSVTAIVDFAHNPHGLEALVHMALELPAQRRAIVIGQAGDRDDESIRALAGIAWRIRPQRVFVKEMEIFLRGRERGVIPEILEGEFARHGAPRESLVRCGSEIEAVRAALVWARPGDLLVFMVHAERADVLALLEQLSRAGWKPGDSLEPSEPATHT